MACSPITVLTEMLGQRKKLKSDCPKSKQWELNLTLLYSQGDSDQAPSERGLLQQMRKEKAMKQAYFTHIWFHPLTKDLLPSISLMLVSPGIGHQQERSKSWNLGAERALRNHEARLLSRPGLAAAMCVCSDKRKPYIAFTYLFVWKILIENLLCLWHYYSHEQIRHPHSKILVLLELTFVWKCKKCK